MQNNSYKIGTWITIGNTSIAEIMSDAGFDWLCIDMEHTVIDYAKAQDLIAIIQGKEKQAYVRVGENNHRIIKRVLDAGADGVIVPMINSKTDAQAAINAVKYPPKGKRGVGLARAHGYGFSFDEYLEKNDNIDIILQIEHINAINELDEILSVDGISATIIGPYDLSASMGKPGKYEDQDVQDALMLYEQKSIEIGIPMGYHIVEVDYNKFISMYNKGYHFLALSYDAMFLGSSVRENIDTLRETLG